MLSVQRFDIIVTLVTILSMCSKVCFLRKQAKVCDFVDTAKEAVTAISQLQQERAGPEMWNTLYEGAVELAAKFEVQPSKPRWKTKTPRSLHVSVHITPKQLVHPTPERIVQLYEMFHGDMPASPTQRRWEKCYTPQHDSINQSSY